MFCSKSLHSVTGAHFKNLPQHHPIAMSADQPDAKAPAADAKAAVAAFKGRCACGKVTLEAKGAPVFSGFCHCSMCRHYFSSPVNLVTGFPVPAVSITQGEDTLKSYKTSERVERLRCGDCGATVIEFVPNRSAAHIALVPLMILVSPEMEKERPVAIPDDLKPKMHIYYPDRVFDVPDGLPKFTELDDKGKPAGPLQLP